MFAQRQECYCAFCKTKRKVYRRKNLSFVEVVGLFLFSALVSYLIWSPFDLRGLAFLITLLGIGELFFRLRWRQSMICQNCGFDPVIYIKDAAQAAEKVKSFLDRRKDDPNFLLRPALNLPTKKVYFDSYEAMTSKASTSLDRGLTKSSDTESENKISLRA